MRGTTWNGVPQKVHGGTRGSMGPRSELKLNTQSPNPVAVGAPCIRHLQLQYRVHLYRHCVLQQAWRAQQAAAA